MLTPFPTNEVLNFRLFFFKFKVVWLVFPPWNVVYEAALTLDCEPKVRCAPSKIQLR